MQIAEEWLKTWICLSLVFGCCSASRPRFDISTDMGMVLVPMDAEVDSAIFRLRATDQDADFPLTFEIVATTSPIVRIENLPCTLYNKVCQANVVLTRRLVPGRLHDFVIRVRDTRGDSNSMQATISVTNATTPRDRIFPHIPSLIMVPEDTKPEKELDYLLVESNPWSGKPVYIELWQPKELFKIRQRQMGSQTKGVITLIGELDFETQSMYTLTMYATDPFTEPGKDSRNIAGIHVVVIVQDVQDVPPVFTLAPPLTKVNNTIKTGDVILRVHAEDGDKGVPREVTYGLISEGNPFTPFFNVSETTGEILLARPLEELTKITHVGAPIVLKIVAEEIRTSRDEPPAQATIVEVGLLLGEPGNSPPYFENDNYIAWVDENAEPGTVIVFPDAYITRVKDEDIGKAGVFALKLDNNNGTFEVSPAVAERTANFIVTVRDNSMIDYERFKSLRFKIVAQEVGPATNLSTSVPVTIFLKDVNDNPPVFDSPVYEVTLSENANVGTKVIQVHATDKDSGAYGRIQYTKITGMGNEVFQINPDTGMITVTTSSGLDREQTSRLGLTVEARDEDGRGLKGMASLVVNILDVNDNPPLFEKGIYEFLLNSELTNFTMPAFVKAIDADAEAPNNVVRYEIVHGNYDNKFQLNEETGELTLREPINKPRKARQTLQLRNNEVSSRRKKFRALDPDGPRPLNQTTSTTTSALNQTKNIANETVNSLNKTHPIGLHNQTIGVLNKTLTTANETSESKFRDFHLFNNLTHPVDLKDQSRQRRAEDDPLFVLTARAYDLGVPHMSSIAQIRIMRPMSAFARTVMFVMPGENPDPKRTAETLALITGSRVTIQEIKPYIQINSGSDFGKRSVVVAKVEQSGQGGTLVDVAKIRESLAANGFGVISGMDGGSEDTSGAESELNSRDMGRSMKNISGFGYSNVNVTDYKAENQLLTWLLVLLALLVLAAIATLISCCLCSSCPFYMEPRKRRIHSSETLIVRADGRPKRSLHRKPLNVLDVGYALDRKEAWSADHNRQPWQFNRRNTKAHGISSLPGDAPQNSEHLHRANSLRNNNHHHSTLMPMDEHRIYMEDVEHGRNYDQAEIDSLRRHELDRGSDRNGGAPPPPAPVAVGNNSRQVREQHFYRDGNAEVLRLVTRGEIEDRSRDPYQANGKDILLQRFIEDQKLRRSQDLRDSFHESIHEGEIDRSMESQQHQRLHETTEILILPERLEMQRQPSYNFKQQQQQDQMMNADIQRLIVERGNYKSSKEDDADDYRSKGTLRASMRDIEATGGETSRSMDNASGRDGNPVYGMHEVELVRQNALLTRLLLERETSRGLTVPILDNASFLETQSLPGQVATATQTDRSASTQTDFIARSRSDNEESEEDPRLRRKTKLKGGRFETKEDFKKMKTIWVRTPIPEETSRAQSGNKKITPTGTKIEVMESRKVSISPDVLKEIENSLKSDEEEDDDERTGAKRAKPDKMQKLATKTVFTSKKKVKEARIDDDSTTPSPETKEKTGLRGKLRKKIEKPPRKKLEKRMESEKSSSSVIEPSFRVLEKEISSFQQKIRQFGDKKLKMLRKEDGEKRSEESEADSGATYGISKKCEMTVKRTNRSVSRESSPTKITVESRVKTSEEESSTKEKIIVTQQQNNSSSDFEEGDQQKKSSLSQEKVTTTSLTRNRSQLRRQPRLENSDASKSSNEKIGKSDESENKAKESSSSGDKVDSSSSKKQMELRRPPEKKILQSQKAVPKARLNVNGDAKRKTVTSKSKTLEEASTKRSESKRDSSKTKSLTSGESKLSSPVRNKEVMLIQKSTEEEKTSIESLRIDLDKLAKDVRGVVEKEISSLTQAARDAISGKSSEQSSLQASSKSKDSSPENKSRVKARSINTSKERNKSPEKTKSPEKLRSHNKSSPEAPKTKEVTKVKSDDAITFIVIEKNETATAAAEHGKMLNEESTRESNGKDKIVRNGIKAGDKKKSPEKVSDVKTFDMSFKVDELKDNLADKVDETKKNVTNEITKAEAKLSNGIDKTKEALADKINMAEETLSHKANETADMIADKIESTENAVIQAAEESKNKIDETKEKILESVEEDEKRIDETKEKVQETIDENEKKVLEKLNAAESEIFNGINGTKKVVSEDLSTAENLISDRFDKIEKDIEEKTSYHDEKKIIDNQKKIDSVINDGLRNENSESDKKINEATPDAELKNDSVEPTLELPAIEADQIKSSEPKTENIDIKINILNSPELAKESTAEMTQAPQQEISMEQKGPVEVIASLGTSENENEGLTKTVDNMLQTNKDEVKIQTPTSPTQTEKMSQADNVEMRPAEIQNPSIVQKNSTDKQPSFEYPKSPTKFRQPARPMLKSQSAIDDNLSHDDDDDSSSTSSDISNKTAVPYATPRGSMSLDLGEALSTTEAVEAKSRPRWHSSERTNPKLEPGKVFPRKIEVSAMDKLNKGANIGTASKITQKEKPTELKVSSEKTTGDPHPPPSRPRPVVVAVKRKERQEHVSSQRTTTTASTTTKLAEDKKSSNSDSSDIQHQQQQRKVEIRSKHMKLQVSHHYRQSSSSREDMTVDHSKDPEIANARSRYMAWYQQKRAEMERKRKEKKEAEEDQLRPKWVRGRHPAGAPRPPRKSKSAENKKEGGLSKSPSKSRERARSTSETNKKGAHPQVSRLNIKPLVNVESEQLKAIVRQGRKLRREEGSSSQSDPPVQIFAPANKPPPPDPLSLCLQVEPRHHLIQHSEYKYEKTVVTAMPFFLHQQPPPVPHSSPEHYECMIDDFPENRRPDDDLDSGIAVSLQGGTRLRNQQLLEKKSVFDIAYNEASPTQLRSDSSTPPS